MSDAMRKLFFSGRLWKLLKFAFVYLALELLGIRYAITVTCVSLFTNRNPLNDFRLDYLETAEAEKETVWGLEFSNIERGSRPLCPENPPNLFGKLVFSNEDSPAPNARDVIMKNRNVDFGGSFSPKECRARHRVAIIIPLRGREDLLLRLLAHMHPIWQRQQLEYNVFVITQSGDSTFNKAKLMNAGVAEARKFRTFDCFVFHDVDILPEDDRCLYWCHDENPRHLAMHVDRFYYEVVSYKIYCPPLSMFFTKIPIFGGATMLSAKQFDELNGYSNLYWGWGGEDDDMCLRILSKGYSVANPYGSYCSYRMMKHSHESSNPPNPARHALMFYAASRMEKEGYNTSRYSIISVKESELFTNITVDVGKPTARMKEFMSKSFNAFARCNRRMPWNL